MKPRWTDWLLAAPREDYTRRLLGAIPRGYTATQ